MLIGPVAQVEPGPLLRSFTAFRYPPTILRALALVPARDLTYRAPGALGALELLERSSPHDPSRAGVQRDRAVAERMRRAPGDNIAVPSTPWEDAVRADQTLLLDAWPDQPQARWVLTPAQHGAYRRLRDRLLDDALDRSAMGG